MPTHDASCDMGDDCSCGVEMDVHALLETIGTYLDHGHYQISAKRAGMLCKHVGGVPKPGYEKRVEWKGYALWVTRTPVRGRHVWAVYPQ